MASDINRVVLIGNLTKDPDLRSTQTGSSVANFSIANNLIYTVSGERKEYTSFFNCIAWGKLGEAIAQYCKKGNRIGLEGRLQQRTWYDQNGNKKSTTEVVVESFQFLTPRKDGGKEEQPEYTGPVSEDEIPF